MEINPILEGILVVIGTILVIFVIIGIFGVDDSNGPHHG